MLKSGRIEVLYFVKLKIVQKLSPARCFLIMLLVTVLSACGSEEPTGSSEIEAGFYPYTKVCRTDEKNEGTDPLKDYQWYLFSDEDSKAEAAAFAATEGGMNHANILKAHELGFTGKCIIVNVVDTGLQLDHPDLRTSQARSYDYFEKDNNPQPIHDQSGDHGTSVAGIIGMKRGNGVGGLGVAPGVILAGHTLLRGYSGSLVDYGKMMGILNDRATELAQIYNQSFGYTPESLNHNNSDAVHQYERNIYERGTRLGRQGEGYIYVKSAGNEFRYRYDIDDLEKVYECNGGETSCATSSQDYVNTLPENILVSATNAAGKLSSYSTTGAGVWLSAPGGEYGYGDLGISLLTGFVSSTDLWRDVVRPNALQPAMVTTDVTGCNNGYSRAFSAPDIYSYREDGQLPNLFEYGIFNKPHPLNAECNYTSIFNGTSSAAPVVSGVVALMLEANPDLGWRDIKHIFATTSTKIDPEHYGHKVDDLTIDYGWQENQAGYWFSNWYGFGQVDGYAAVLKARDYTADMGIYTSAEADSADRSLDISNDNKDGLITSASIKKHIIIESVRLTITIEGGNPFDLGIILESPGGTKTSLLPAGSAYKTSDGYSINKTSFLTNALYGEDASGTWTLRIYDFHDSNTDTTDPFQSDDRVGKLKQWSIEINGQDTQPMNDRSKL